MRKSLPWFGIAGLVILLDQLSKWLILESFQNGESVPVTGFFNLVLVYNPGAAFSFLAGAGGMQKWFFVILALAISAWIAFMLIRHPEQKRQGLALSLILGGAIGNVIDRIAHGAVVDFLDVYVGVYHWPAFNVADAAITLGAILMVWDALRKSPEPA